MKPAEAVRTLAGEKATVAVPEDATWSQLYYASEHVQNVAEEAASGIVVRCNDGGAELRCASHFPPVIIFFRRNCLGPLKIFFLHHPWFRTTLW